ncbi:MAG: GMC family oxidoreductase [Kiritimatiellia bacterium]|nr:GMC family oxidoreductase [Pseudomonadales bacterium]MDP6469942.1 GMC family oxidoreductase [Pseudomonadales bacterium]MDP6828962.1 GMC family oxidoreductase [Pseudomonadales bacterium]MDP7024667.1 GMC family oxidoreductase [Kiritimatiellia bacterium]
MTRQTIQAAEYDVCVVGSGAGGAPVAFDLANAGYKVAVLEKGGWFDEQDFKKDEMLFRRKRFRSKVDSEPHVIEEPERDGSWSMSQTGRFWGGNVVGGASNFMSGYFHRLKPTDFRLLSEFGPIEGANVTDWPIDYDELEPYYTLVEQVVGVSGTVVAHPNLEPRSTPDYPFPAATEHTVARRFDKAAKELGLHPFPMARSILTQPFNGRGACEYSGYCGSYGCHTGAKGSARAALIDRAVVGGNCDVLTHAMAYRINTDRRGNAESVDYYDRQQGSVRVRARVVVVACYSIESSRLLLASAGGKHPDGIGNLHQQIGKHLHCCAGGTGHGIFDLTRFAPREAMQLSERGPFFNRALQDWYVIDDEAVFGRRVKGGTLDFVFDPPSPTVDANSLKWDEERNLVWGSAFKRKLVSHFTETRDFKFEAFCDWLPTDDCHVTLDGSKRDKWGLPVARVRVGYHSHDLKIARYLVDRGVEVMKQMGAQKSFGNASTIPTTNLIAGGLRFGRDARTSALDADCRVRGTDNLFVTDGSFMPTGGSVTPTSTIYANAFRVADRITAQLTRPEG